MSWEGLIPNPHASTTRPAYSEVTRSTSFPVIWAYELPRLTVGHFDARLDAHDGLSKSGRNSSPL
jgi:hypothetical protein